MTFRHSAWLRVPERTTAQRTHQEDSGIGTLEKITIGGIKFSPEQVQLTLPNILLAETALNLLLKNLAQQEINLTFLCINNSQESFASLCLASSDYIGVQGMINDILQSCDIVPTVITSVGTLSLFPHQSSMSILGHTLSVFGEYNLPVYAMGSSLSAIVIVTDYDRLDQAAETLQSVFHLPDNHSPFNHQPSVNTIDD